MLELYEGKPSRTVLRRESGSNPADLAGELLTPDEVRALDNRYAILFIRGAKPVMDLKYELMNHPAIRHTVDSGGPPYIHHQKKPETWLPGAALFAPEDADTEKEEPEHEQPEEK